MAGEASVQCGSVPKAAPPPVGTHRSPLTGRTFYHSASSGERTISPGLGVRVIKAHQALGAGGACLMERAAHLGFQGKFARKATPVQEWSTTTRPGGHARCHSHPSFVMLSAASPRQLPQSGTQVASGANVSPVSVAFAVVSAVASVPSGAESRAPEHRPAACVRLST